VTRAEEQGGAASWKLPCAAAVLACAARAVLFASKEGYAAKGLYAVAARSASRDLVEALVPLLALALVFVLWQRHSRPGRGIQLAAAGCLLVIAYLFIAGLAPAAPVQAPRFDTARGQAGHAAAVLAATGAAALAVFGRRLRPAAARLATVAAWAVAAAAGAVLVLPTTRLRGGEASRVRPNVILISLDTVRADRLGSYGYALPTTPEIDRFFSESTTRFDAAFAPQPWTLTSHLTMLTSLHPAVHGVDKEKALPPRVRTLAQVLSSHGYVTAGHVYDLIWMEERYGFDRGFHLYRRLGQDIRSRKPFVDALLDDIQEDRFFLFLHYYDAHSGRGTLPYDSDAEDRAAFAGWYKGSFTGCDAEACSTHLLWAMNRKGRTLAEEDRRYVAALYDAAVRTLDRGLGDLFRGLEGRGLLDRTIVVLTADHGEEFQEHGKLLHTQAYDESMHVPLLVRAPGAGRVRASSRLVGLEDVAPTILDLCGIAPLPEMQGRSLRPLITGEKDPGERSQVLMMDEDGRLGLRTATWKLLSTQAGTELYDLANDPAERNDLIANGAVPTQAQRLRRQLDDELKRAVGLRASLGVRDAQGLSLSESQKEQLRALSYVQE